MDTSNNAREGESQISIDIEDLDTTRFATSIQEMIRTTTRMHNDHSIFRAPTRQRTGNENMYIPRDVSLGPLHHGKKELATMEKHKLEYLQAFVNRPNMSLEACISVTKKYKDKARNCYAEQLEFGDDQFVQILLVDSCFIIEVMLRATADNTRTKTDYLSSPELTLAVMPDMILLENQIPFVLLDDLYSKASKDDKFLDLSIRYFYGPVMPDDTSYDKLRRTEPKHFLDLLRTSYLPSIPWPQPTKEAGSYIRIRSATKLKEVGIDFQRDSSDVEYSKGVLKVPVVRLYDGTEILLRNLVALEQCLYPYDSYVIDHILFMDGLINSSKDVNLLAKKGIIKGTLSDNSVAALFNDLGRQCALWSSDYYYHRVSEDLNAYYIQARHKGKATWYKWKTTLKRDYCSTPWMVASTMAAII